MITDMRNIIAEAVVPNGRWGDQYISVERVSDAHGDRIIYHDGHSDPLNCGDDIEAAMRFFNARLPEGASK